MDPYSAGGDVDAVLKLGTRLLQTRQWEGGHNRAAYGRLHSQEKRWQMGNREFGQINGCRLPHLSVVPIAAYVFPKIHILLAKLNTTSGHDIDSPDHVDSHMI